MALHVLSGWNAVFLESQVVDEEREVIKIFLDALSRDVLEMQCAIENDERSKICYIRRNIDFYLNAIGVW